MGTTYKTRRHGFLFPVSMAVARYLSYSKRLIRLDLCGKPGLVSNCQIGSNLAWLLSFMFIVHSFQSLSHLKFILLAICRTSWFEKGQSG